MEQNKLSKDQALKIIKKILKNGFYSPTKHFRKRMNERDFDILDVLYAIKKGNIYNEPELHPKTDRWTYTVEGVTIGGQKIKIVVDIDEENNRIRFLTGIIN